MKRVLVTGGTGFIGANLVRRLLNDGHDVHLFVRPGYNSWRIEDIRSQIILHSVDLLDQGLVSRTVELINPQWVFHAAAYGAYSWQTDFQRMRDTNVFSTIQIVKACGQSGCESVVVLGSSSEYGIKHHAPCEDERIEPYTRYAVTKAASTLFCRFFAQHHALKVTIVRPYSVYGPYEDPRRLVPQIMVQGLKGTLPPLTSPESAHDFVWIDDVVDACLLCAERRNSEKGIIYNVGSGSQISLREVICKAKSILGFEDEPRWGSLPAHQGENSVWVSDHRRISKDLGWEPKISFDQGLSKMAHWITSTPSMNEFYSNFRA